MSSQTDFFDIVFEHIRASAACGRPINIQEAVNSASFSVFGVDQRKYPREFDHPYLELCEEIPGGLPDGTGIFSPIGWIRWAKKELGYE